MTITEWDEALDYVKGDLVRYRGQVFLCVADVSGRIPVLPDSATEEGLHAYGAESSCGLSEQYAFAATYGDKDYPGLSTFRYVFSGRTFDRVSFEYGDAHHAWLVQDSLDSAQVDSYKDVLFDETSNWRRRTYTGLSAAAFDVPWTLSVQCDRDAAAAYTGTADLFIRNVLFHVTNPPVAAPSSWLPLGGYPGNF